jgi:hypothetical protein
MLTHESFGLRRQVAAFPRRDMSRRSKAQSCLRTPKLPNEPNLKTAPPAIPASGEGQTDEIYKAIIFNIL